MARKSRKHPESTRDMPRIYRTGIYARLSREYQQTETIETQIEEIKKFLEYRPDFQIVDIYADNGYTGTNFQRPEFQRLMEDVRNRKIDCIIVKDLSRFAREHIGAEDYLNNIFPFLGVRFIAINDGYDNIHIEPQEYFMASFKNLAHAHFAQETSRKVTMAKRTLQEQGKFIGSKTAYGYMRDPKDKHKLIPDPKIAPIVLDIFEMAAEGKTTVQICKMLNSDSPDGHIWKPERIYAILNNEIYRGTLTQHRQEQALYKNQKRRMLSKEEYIRHENVVPPIVTQELWDKAHKALAERAKKKHEGIPENPYKGLVFCGKCGIKISGGFKRGVNDFTFCCNRCKCGIFTKGKYLANAVRNELQISDSTKITRELVTENFTKILITEKKELILLKKEGDIP